MTKKKNKKKTETINLGATSSDDDVKNAILYAYFDSKKPEDSVQYQAFKLLVKITKFNITEITK